MMDLIKRLFGNKDLEVLKEVLRRKAFLVDVRSPEEFVSGSVVGAINIPLGTLPEQLEKFEGKDGIVVFCRSGMRSGQAKVILEKAGHGNVVNGGAWQRVQGALEESD
ncbi:MAG: rhodanese-like domain-containing protein [Sphingobacterium sp.]|nr:rhodanese-like domain-containing protein [Sphingobacterium sp.]